MTSSAWIVAFSSIAVVCCYIVLSSKYNAVQIEDVPERLSNIADKLSTQQPQDPIKHTDGDFMKMKHKLDELSQALVRHSKNHHQLQCKMILENDRNQGISSHGGWCNGTKNAQGYKRDGGLIKELIPLFQGYSVVSLGEGPGLYKNMFDESKELEIYDGFDGAPFIENATEGLVKFTDLSVPLYGMKIYDWVMSLEVGEHIPKEFEEIVLDNMANHARLGIVLSWAVPGQGGYGHVNGKTLESLVEDLGKREFFWDEEQSKILQSKCSIAYIRRNVNLYRRKKSSVVNPLWS